MYTAESDFPRLVRFFLNRCFSKHEYLILIIIIIIIIIITGSLFPLNIQMERATQHSLWSCHIKSIEMEYTHV